MNPNQQNLLELARQGNARAIAALVNRSLQPKGITAKVNLKDRCLQVLVEADKTPNQEPITTTNRRCKSAGNSFIGR